MARINRIFYDGELEDFIKLDEDTSHRVSTVLRLVTGDRLIIVTRSFICDAEIATLSKKKVLLKILSKRESIKPEHQLTVYQCIAKREYMDGIIEKYTEIGATKIVPVISAYSQSNVIKPNTLGRYRSIVINASLQSESEFIPKLAEPIDIRTIKDDAKYKLLFYERSGEKKLPENFDSDVSMIVGAEGGFSELEYNLLIEKGFIAYHPIKKILKAETAAAVFSYLVMMKMDNE